MNALILIDIQNDFLPGGALAIPQSDKILPIINHLLKYPFDHIIATKDWHPSDHGSFAINQGKKTGELIILEGIQQILWPVHCIQESFGAEISSTLDQSKIEEIFYKGIDKNVDSYSAFFDNAQKNKTGLEEFLKRNAITEIYLAGLATDYCVLYSTLDAIALGFNPSVIVDACCGVNLNPEDSERAIEQMRSAGAHLITSKELLGG